MTKPFSKDPNVLRVVNTALHTGNWSVERGSGHGKLRHSSGRMVVFASTASDHRSSNNLARDIRHVECGMPGRGQPNVVVGVVLGNKKRDNSLTN